MARPKPNIARRALPQIAVGSSIKPFSPRPSPARWITPLAGALSAPGAFSYRTGNGQVWPSDLDNGMVVIHDLNADKYIELLPVLRAAIATDLIQAFARVWILSGVAQNNSEIDFLAQHAFDMTLTSGALALPAGAVVMPAGTTGNPRFGSTIAITNNKMPDGAVKALHSGSGSIASVIIDKTSASGLLIEFSTNGAAVPADAVFLLGREY